MASANRRVLRLTRNKILRSKVTIAEHVDIRDNNRLRELLEQQVDAAGGNPDGDLSRYTLTIHTQAMFRGAGRRLASVSVDSAGRTLVVRS